MPHPRPEQRKVRVVLLVALGSASFAAAFGLTRVTSHQSDPPGMVWKPGGEFTMGTDGRVGWDDERPAHRARVDGFWMDETDVTNAQFRAFVEATRANGLWPS